MLVIALTGGIGSGKSTVSDLFAQKNIPVIDTDVISREVVEPGKVAYLNILNLFGEEVLDDDKKINRAYLREQVFTNKEKRIQLEKILHPVIWKEVLARISSLRLHNNIPYCIVVVPLLFESQESYKKFVTFDRILTLDVPEATQLQRTMKRDNCSEALVKEIINSQVSHQQRIELADDIITNTDDFASLEKEVEKYHHFYLQLQNK